MSIPGEQQPTVSEEEMSDGEEGTRGDGQSETVPRKRRKVAEEESSTSSEPDDSDSESFESSESDDDNEEQLAARQQQIVARPDQFADLQVQFADERNEFGEANTNGTNPIRPRNPGRVENLFFELDKNNFQHEYTVAEMLELEKENLSKKKLSCRYVNNNLRCKHI